MRDTVCMIPYDELDRALARWKSRTQPVDAAREFEESGAVPAAATNGTSGHLPAPPDRTGEIEIGDAAIETYEDN